MHLWYNVINDYTYKYIVIHLLLLPNISMHVTVAPHYWSVYCIACLLDIYSIRCSDINPCANNLQFAPARHAQWIFIFCCIHAFISAPSQLLSRPWPVDWSSWWIRNYFEPQNVKLRNHFNLHCTMHICV